MSKVVALTGSLLAWLLGGAMMGEPSSSIRQFSSNLSGALAPDKDHRLKVPLSIAVYSRFDVVDKNGKRLQKSRQGLAKVYLLNARTEKPNHFFLDGFHIVIEPVAWVRETGRYTFAMDLLKSYGNFRRVEESFGKIQVTGFVRSSDDAFHFEGYKKHQFLDRTGKPKAMVELGRSSTTLSGRADGKANSL